MKTWKSVVTFLALTGLGVSAGLLTRPVGTAHASTAATERAPMTSARAIPAIVAALTAEDEVEDGAQSRVPRPAGSKRLYFSPFDDVTLVTVYVAQGAPADVFRGYSSALAASGFVVHYDLPGLTPGVTVIAKRPGGSSVLITIGAGETGTLVTLVETVAKGEAR